MTHVIKARNVCQALYEGLSWLHFAGNVSSSRNGRVIVSGTPVVTEYYRPNERVLFSALRDANPFFHLMESLWMLAGRNDVRFPAYYAANIASFSDDGVTIAGAYGERWRSRFGYDQLARIIEELKANPDSRRCVLSMWQPEDQMIDYGHDVQKNDLWLAMNGGKDVPCNTQVYFDTLEGALNMTVTCRSNDLVWGCYGANAVHFSMLHEYVALSAGLPQGVYRQFSNNYHSYADRPDVQRLHQINGMPKLEVLDDRYETGIQPYPLINVGPDHFDADLKIFFGEWKEGQVMAEDGYVEPFFSGVVVPMVNAHHAYKAGDIKTALDVLRWCIADDWHIACREWLERRLEKQNG